VIPVAYDSDSDVVSAPPKKKRAKKGAAAVAEPEV